MTRGGDAWCDDGSATALRLALVCATSGVPAEIVLVVDRSYSIGLHNFELVKRFLKTLQSQLHISQAVTRVALVSYAETVSVDFDLGMYNDNVSVSRHVDRLTNRMCE